MILSKFAAENLLFDFDFSKRSEIVAGDTLNGAVLTQAVITGSGVVALGAAAIEGSKVKFTIAAGVAGSLYRIVCTATTNGGRTIVAVGDLQVN